MPKRLLLHVGYHKTATSWMQNLLFVPGHGYQQISTHKEVFSRIVQPHGLRFDPAPMRALIAERMAGLGEGEVPVISSEILSGHPFLGARESDVFAERLKQIAPDARILVSIRAQMSILPSVYMQYILRGGTMPYDRFFQGTEEPGYFGFSPEHFEYDRLIARYQALFGAENVYILTQESLKADMDGAVKALADFAGAVKFNGLMVSARRVHAASYPEYGVGVLRRLNHVQHSTLNPTPIISLGRTPRGLYKVAGYLLRRPPLSTLLADYRPVSTYVRARFQGHFTESNRQLSAIVTHPIDLSAYP